MIDKFAVIKNFVKFNSLENKKNFNSNIWKINIAQLEKWLNILSVQMIIKNEKLNSKIKLSNNSSFVILIFAILKFRNIGRSTFPRSKFWPPHLHRLTSVN